MSGRTSAGGSGQLPALPPRAEVLALLQRMELIRAFEEQVRLLYASGQVPGLVHLCAGQEAVAVGVCSVLEVSDWIASNHRGHGHCIAKGARIESLLAEIMGRRSGYGLGRSGTLHIYDPANGNLGTNGIVAGGVPLAAGAALTARTRGDRSVAVTFFGDGALNQGLLFEVMNMAAVWKLPVVFVCENNGYGEFTPLEAVTAGRIGDRGAVFDMPVETVDGMDVLAVRAAAGRAVERGRADQGPTFLVCNTYRYSGHHATDRQDYKDAAEAAAWEQRDPIRRLAQQLIDGGIATEAELQMLTEQVAAEIAAAVGKAAAAPLPPTEEIWRHLHA